jgi:hypothetical protein
MVSCQNSLNSKAANAGEKPDAAKIFTKSFNFY